MSQVIIGMDPHKHPATIEIMTSDETVVGGGAAWHGQRRTADVVKRSLLDDGEDRGTLSRPGMPP